MYLAWVLERAPIDCFLDCQWYHQHVETSIWVWIVDYQCFYPNQNHTIQWGMLKNLNTYMWRVRVALMYLKTLLVARSKHANIGKKSIPRHRNFLFLYKCKKVNAKSFQVSLWNHHALHQVYNKLHIKNIKTWYYYTKIKKILILIIKLNISIFFILQCHFILEYINAL